MDFLEFEQHDLYFDEALSVEDETLLKKAADAYPSEETETILRGMQLRLPENLTILVALYRFYYYQHRYQDALDISARAIDVSASMMGLAISWEDLTESHIAQGVFVSMGLIRFYMLCIKASAYLLMRIGEIEQAEERLKKIIELDPADQFGAAFLLKMAEKELIAKLAKQHNIESLFHH